MLFALPKCLSVCRSVMSVGENCLITDICLSVGEALGAIGSLTSLDVLKEYCDNDNRAVSGAVSSLYKITSSAYTCNDFHIYNI